VPAHDVLSRRTMTVVETTTPGRLVEAPGPRWSHVLVPIIFFTFLIPGVVFGLITGTLKNQRDFVDGLYHGVRSIVPVIVLAFFLGQFVNYLGYTNLDRMLAYAGGSLLVRADLPIPLLIVLFVLLVICGDFAISGMIAKFAILAPIFIPMFMMVGASPELTTAAYRIGDSVVNVITPLNAYLLIILTVLQRYKKDAGLGTLIALMLPYSACYAVAWTSFLLLWYFLGLPLGPGSPLHYSPAE
jgi:aminobenzoyl-glutamate transport protein